MSRRKRRSKLALVPPPPPAERITRLCLNPLTGEMKEMTVEESPRRLALGPDGHLQMCDEDDPRPYVHKWNHTKAPQALKDNAAGYFLQPKPEDDGNA